MLITRSFALVVLILLACGIVCAQQPGPEFWKKLSCQPFEPRTRLEAIESKYGSVVLRGFTQISTVEVRGVRIDAVEMRLMGSRERARGIVVVLRQSNEQNRDNRAFVDYEELPGLLNAIDSLNGVDETITKLASFEAHYRTRGDLELRVFRQTRSGTAVTIETGICDLAIQSLSLDDLAKVKAMIQEAKTRLEELP